jgi:hypothetical protein
VETMSLYEVLGGVAFLMMIGAQVLAVLVLKRMLAETKPDADRKATEVIVPPPAVEPHADASHAFRSRYVRDFVRRTT